MIFDAVNHFHQPKDGYRFSADSLLLAEFADLRGGARAADFGAGCGVVGLSALEKGRAAGLARLFFVERDPELRAALEMNLALYRPRTATDLVAIPGDWRRLTPADFHGPLDYVLSNPPYFPLGSGRPSRHPGREAARREVFGGLADLIAAAARLLAPGGRLALMLPARRTAELEAGLAKTGFRAERREVVRAEASGADRLVLAEARAPAFITPATE